MAPATVQVSKQEIQEFQKSLKELHDIEATLAKKLAALEKRMKEEKELRRRHDLGLYNEETLEAVREHEAAKEQGMRTKPLEF
ncbi:hypothetical protein HYS48_00620 [Candidatus Woesearchaeota archaeon]|nr:hypothetical protein [Candidatus Woesearchaeota archaeon]